ncbi:unnamed protein product, partial [Closterium sp. NIES-54]
DVTFDESVPFYHLFPYRSAPLPPPPLFLALGPPLVEPLPPQGPAPSGAAFGGAASGGIEPERAEPGGAEPVGAEGGGTEPEGAVPKGAEYEGAESWGAEPRGTASSGGPAAARAGESAAGGTGARGAGATSLGGAGVPAGAGGLGGAGAAGPGGARTRGTGAAGAGGAGGAGAGDSGTGGAGAGGIGAIDPDPRAGDAGAGGVASSGTGAGGTVQRHPFFVPPLSSSLPPPDSVLRQVLSLLSSTNLSPTLLSSPPCQSQPQLHPDSPLPAPSSYAEQKDSFTKRREPESRLASPVRAVSTGRRVPRPRPPPVPSTHNMALRPSSVPLRVPLPHPLESSLHASANPPSAGGESALGKDVLEDRQEDFECLATAVPHLVAMLLAPQGDPDAPDIPTPRSYAEAITSPYSSQWQAAMDAKMASWKSTGTYVDEVPLPGANIVDGMWIFRVKRPPGYPPAFKARYVARGFSQPQGVDYFHTFSPILKMTTLGVLLHVAAQRDNKLHSLDFSTVFLQGSLHEEILLRRPPGFTESFPAGTQWSLQRPVYGLRQAPREWHGTLRTTLAALGFAPSSADPSMFLRTDTSLSPFYVLVYVDDLVFATADTEALTLVMSRLQKRHICTDMGELRSYLGLQIGTEHGAPSH